jgi:hypothetical protein
MYMKIIYYIWFHITMLYIYMNYMIHEIWSGEAIECWFVIFQLLSSGTHDGRFSLPYIVYLEKVFQYLGVCM